MTKNNQSFQLYDYQQELVNDARQAYKDGYTSPCIVLGCGGGKSVIIAEIIKTSTERKKKVLFIVHRRELINQIGNTLRQHGVNMDYVKLGMVQTISRNLEKMERPDLIVIDENHHVIANSYRKIINHFNSLVLGFTATPIRLNGDGLGDVNDVLLEGPSTKWLIENNRLSPYIYYSLGLSDGNQLNKSSTGDFTSGSIEKSFGDAIYGDVVKHYQELADGQKAILYAHSVKYSKAFADEFNKSGIPAEHIDGKTATKKRDEIMQDFRDGKIKVICNVDILGEGFDVPDCTAVILARPTASLSLHIQQSMRPMRYQPNKTAIIIDHVGNVFRHGLPDMHREWTLGKKEKRKRSEVEDFKVVECQHCLMVFDAEKIEKKQKIIDGEIVTYFNCPACGHENILTVQKDKKIDKEVKLSVIKEGEAEKIFYRLRDWKQAKSYKELLKIAEAKEYKPSWAAFKAKELNLPDTPRWVYQYETKKQKYNFNF